jgi:hypothetical protein
VTESPIEVNENRLKLTDAQFKNSKLVLTTLATKNIPTILKLHGKIDVPPQNMVSISVPLGGYLKSTSLLPGMHVNKGQVIAQMEDQQYIQMQEDYLTAVNKLDLYLKEYNRLLKKIQYWSDVEHRKGKNEKDLEHMRQRFRTDEYNDYMRNYMRVYNHKEDNLASLPVNNPLIIF